MGALRPWHRLPPARQHAHSLAPTPPFPRGVGAGAAAAAATPPPKAPRRGGVAAKWGPHRTYCKMDRLIGRGPIASVNCAQNFNAPKRREWELCASLQIWSKSAFGLCSNDSHSLFSLSSLWRARAHSIALCARTISLHCTNCICRLNLRAAQSER